MIRKLKTGDYRLYSRKPAAKLTSAETWELFERAKLPGNTKEPSNSSSGAEVIRRRVAIFRRTVTNVLAHCSC